MKHIIIAKWKYNILRMCSFMNTCFKITRKLNIISMSPTALGDILRNALQVQHKKFSLPNNPYG